MKLERRTSTSRLWQFLREALPSSLRAMEMPSEYGKVCAIYALDRSPGLHGRMFDLLGDPVAVVTGNEVVLYHPQWFSDFEALLQRFELEHKPSAEPKLVYWEG